MTNPSISQVNHSLPQAPSLGISVPKKDDRIGKIALPNISAPIKKEEPGRLLGLGYSAGAYFIEKVLSYGKERDENILKNILAEETDLTALTREFAPQLLALVSPFLPEKAKMFMESQKETGEKMTDGFLLRMITNLSLSLLPEEIQNKALNGEKIPLEARIPQDELAEKIMSKMVHLIGEDLNAIDQKVLDNPKLLHPRLFRPTVEKIYNLILPEGDGFRGGLLGEFFNVKDQVLSKGSEGFFSLYESLLKWIKKEDQEPSNSGALDFTPIQSGAKRVLGFLNQELRKKWLGRDQALFERLTGTGDIHVLAEKISPQIYEQLSQYLPKEISSLLLEENTQEDLKQSTQMVLLHAIASLAKEVFQEELESAEQVSPEEMIAKAASHFAGKIQVQFDKVRQKQERGHEIGPSDFEDFTFDLMKIFLPDSSHEGEFQWLNQLINRRQKELTEPLHQLLLSFYLSQPNHGKVDEYKNRLKAVLQGEEESSVDAAVEQLYHLSSNLADMIKNQVATPLKNAKSLLKKNNILQGDEVQKALANHVTAGLSAMLEGSDPQLNWFEKQLQQSLEHMIFRSIVHLLEKVPPEERIPSGQLLMHALHLILKPCLDHLPQIAEELELEKGRILLEVKLRVNDPDSKDYIADKELRKAVIEKEVTELLEELGAKLIAPFLDEFMGLFFENEEDQLEDQIPLIQELRDPICEYLREGLASQFSKMLIVTTSWMQDRKKNETRLAGLYHSKNPLKLCNVMGHMAKDGLLWTLREDSESHTRETVIPFLKPYFCEAGADPEEEAGDLTLMQNMIQGFFHSFGTDASPELEKLMDFMGNFTETVLLRLMTDFSKRFKEMEEAQSTPPPYSAYIEASKKHWIANIPDKSKEKKGNFAANRIILKNVIRNSDVTDEQLYAFIKFTKVRLEGKFLTSLADVFVRARGTTVAEFLLAHEKKNESLLENLLLGLIEEAGDHFELIGTVKKGKKKKLSRDQLIEGFEQEGKLHPAVKEGEGRTDFYKELSQSIFQIIGISQNSYLPIPEFFKKTAWKLIEDKLMPKILNLSIDAARKPTNLNKMLVSALQDSVDVVKQDENSFLAKLLPNEDELDERIKSYNPRFKDSYQQQLEGSTGKLLDSVINLQGRSIPRCLLNIKFKGNRILLEPAARAMGQPIRSIFRDEEDRPVSSLQLLNRVMGIAADSVVEVEWNERENKIVYPKTGFDGTKLPENDEYVERPNLTKFFPKTEQEKSMAADLERRERKKAEQEVPFYLKKIISNEAKQYVRNKFVKKWDLLEAKLKEKCPNLSKVLVPILSFLIKLPLLIAVYILDVCIWCVVDALLRLVLSKQIAKYAKDANVDVHDNMIYKMLELGMGKIVESMEQMHGEESSEESSQEKEVLAVAT